MFFYIGDNCPIKSLKQVEPRLFLDDGWNQVNGSWYKGYSTDCVLAEHIDDIIRNDNHRIDGKWCVIHNNQIYHPLLRGFPLYQKGDSKTNLKLSGYDIVTYECPSAPKFSDRISLEDAAKLIGDILVENTSNLYKYNKIDDITVLVSAGLDTLTAWAVVDQVTKDYTVSIHLPSETDNTLRSFVGTERDYESDLMDKVGEDYWGYNHACFYKQHNWNITGYYAETLTYRDGEAINAIANHHGKKIDELANENDYLYWFLKRPNIVEKYRDSMLEFSNDAELKRFLWSTIWYDHQMWHLDNNMMFSPFADIRIPCVMDCLKVSDIALNSVTGAIQRKIIERFKPELLAILSDYKNAKDIWGNFRANFNESLIPENAKIIYR